MQGIEQPILLGDVVARKQRLALTRRRQAGNAGHAMRLANSVAPAPIEQHGDVGHAGALRGGQAVYLDLPGIGVALGQPGAPAPAPSVGGYGPSTRFGWRSSCPVWTSLERETESKPATSISLHQLQVDQAIKTTAGPQAQ